MCICYKKKTQPNLNLIKYRLDFETSCQPRIAMALLVFHYALLFRSLYFALLLLKALKSLSLATAPAAFNVASKFFVDTHSK